MLKNILNLKGAQQLSKDEQKSIVGGHNKPSGNRFFCGPWNVNYPTASECGANCDGTCAYIINGDCWVCIGQNNK